MSEKWKTIIWLAMGLRDSGTWSHFWHLGQDVCAINILEFDGQNFKLLQMNYTGHLDVLG